MFPLCYICFTKIVQFEKRNSGDVQLIFIFTYKYSERRAQRQAEITFSAWLYRTAPMFYKYTKNLRNNGRIRVKFDKWLVHIPFLCYLTILLISAEGAVYGGY